MNQLTQRIRRFFPWAVAEELTPPATDQALQAVPGLNRGRCTARESEPVNPVAEDHLQAVKLHVNRQVWALIQLQLHTAARSGELVVMRARDINTGERVWTYTPSTHKTEHHGHIRTIYLGPNAQQIASPFMVGRSRDAYLFSPKDAEATRLAHRHETRTTPLKCGNVPGSNRTKHPAKEPGDCYTVKSYARAITRACKAAQLSVRTFRTFPREFSPWISAATGSAA